MNDHSTRILEPNPAFRARQRKEHAAAFRLATQMGRAVGDAAIRPLPLRTDVARALDILMQQAWQAHSGVCILSERSFVEDAALLCRRLLELAVQAAYIATPEDKNTKLDRARRFLAKMWASAPPQLRERLGPQRVASWEARFQVWRAALPEKPKHWWPTFQTLFTDLGHEETYEEDYRFLSSVAHGASSYLAFDFADDEASKYTRMSASPFLVHSSRYLLATAHCWNTQFQIIEHSVLAELIAEVGRVRLTIQSSGRAARAADRER